MKSPLLTIATLGLLGLITACTPPQQRGAAYGGLGGAALGAVAGDSRSDVITGAAVGAAVGTGVAAINEDAKRRQEAEETYYGSRSTPRDDTPTRGNYPTAERTNNPAIVLSPYAPYPPVNVEGYRSGQLVKDPSNLKIFRVP